MPVKFTGDIAQFTSTDDDAARLTLNLSEEDGVAIAETVMRYKRESKVLVIIMMTEEEYARYDDAH